MVKYPLVSVIIPTYNRVKKVGAAIESALQQTYPNKQVIVVDDGSSDGTDLLMKKYPGVEYVWQENKGQASARNTGLKHSRGKYVASLDSDDIWKKNFLEITIDALEEMELDFVFANWYQDDGNGNFVDPFSSYDFLKPYMHLTTDRWTVLDDQQLRALYLDGCPSPSSALVMRHSSIVSEWNEILEIADDWCIIMDMIFSKKCRAAFTKQKLWQKHIDGSNIYDGRNQNEVLQYLYVHDKEVLYKRYHKQFTKAERKAYRSSMAYYLTQFGKQQFLLNKSYAECFKTFRKALLTDPKQVYSFIVTETKLAGKKIIPRPKDIKPGSPLAENFKKAS